MQIERERKFLVRGAPPLPDAGVKVTQSYLAIEPGGGNETRIRRKGDRFFLTIKSGESGLARKEAEIEITARQFDELWSLAEKRAVEKIRYEVPLSDGLVAEVDVFSGRHDGLVLVEVEFDSDEQAAEFEPPAWFGEEVTNTPQYKNKNLATQQ